MQSRTIATVLACVVVLLAGYGPVSGQQGSSPCVTPSLPPAFPSTPYPSGTHHEAWVDPLWGDDTTGAPGVAAPFRTIQAAADALALLIGSDPLASGVVRLLPGRYGWAPAGSQVVYNGEVWPVALPPGVSLVGVSAQNVMLDGGAVAPTSAAINIPDPITGQTHAVIPVLHLGGAAGHDYTVVSHLTILGAEVGALIEGSGAIGAKLASSLFTQCDVGVQIHSTGAASEGIHRPVLFHCTLANNVLGLAVTGDDPSGGPGPLLVRAHPLLLNTLFKNAADFEGVGCLDVLHCAFDPAAINQSAAILQPLESPTPIFDSGAYGYGQLFLGPRYLPPGQVPTPSGPLVTDYRLSFTTGGQPSVVNPARSGGLSIYPALAGNGTMIDLLAASGPLGERDGEGNGNPGPTNPNNPHGTGIGYDVAGIMHVGGSAPVSNRFGLALGGTMFNTVDSYVDPTVSSIWLLVTAVNGPGLQVAGDMAPHGVLSVSNALPVPFFQGAFSLDLSYPWIDFSPFLGLLGGSQNKISLQLGITALPAPLLIASQIVGLDAGGLPVFSEPQIAILDPSPVL